MSVVRWFFDEAGITCIVGFLTLIVGLLSYLYTRRRQRAPKVVIQELESIRLVDIHPTQRERLQVTYTDLAGNEYHIESLEQKRIAIYNNGTQDIKEPVQFTLEFYEVDSGEDTIEDHQWPFSEVASSPELSHERAPDRGAKGFWQLVFDDPQSAYEPIYGDTEDVCIGARLRLPYLNSHPQHKLHVTAHLISEQSIRIQMGAERSGKGWSAQFVPFHRLLDLQYQTPDLAPVTFGVVLALLAGIIVLVAAHFFSDPWGQAVLHPSAENIRLAVQDYEAELETLRTSGGLEFLKVGGMLWPSLLAGLAILVTAIGSKLSDYVNRLWRLIAFKRLGLLPPSEFGGVRWWW